MRRGRRGNMVEMKSDVTRMTPAEGAALLDSANLAEIAAAADAVCRRMHPEPWRTYNVDRNINYTNVCRCRCRFCAFSRDAEDADAYVIPWDAMFRKIQETVALGGEQILLQGGLNPALRLTWFEQLFREIKTAFPTVNIHGLTPTEIAFLAEIEDLPLETVLDRLAAAGLGSLPGGGAEILVDGVRQIVSPKKIMTDGWLRVHALWHARGGRSTATMMFGHVETHAQRMEHLARIRDLQDRTGGFTAFIPWTYQPVPHALWPVEIPRAGTFAYLKTLAVSRIFLDNIPNIQASWVTQGMKIGALALAFGANDLGSVMIEENVVAACGTRFAATEAELRDEIRRAGFTPRRRNVFYELRE